MVRWQALDAGGGLEASQYIGYPLSEKREKKGGENLLVMCAASSDLMVGGTAAYLIEKKVGGKKEEKGRLPNQKNKSRTLQRKDDHKSNRRNEKAERRLVSCIPGPPGAGGETSAVQRKPTQTAVGLRGDEKSERKKKTERKKGPPGLSR